uniref:Reverse transcriptase zinc-binding domain-containing protein n=1 Tax=Aegilops tauschii subsp. strangulata TaxID=200361 RepID=A0A453RL58_AEGTS
VPATAQFTWKSKAPLRCRFFLWLAMKNRCWTADRLARRGLPHPDACPFCDQHEETLDHIELTCVFARTIRRTLCTTIGKPAWTPEGHETSVDWCADKPKNMRVIITLVLWEMWKHRSAIVLMVLHPRSVGSLCKLWKKVTLGV